MLMKDMEVYKASLCLVRDVYDVCRTFPKEEIYCLTSQMKRSVISIPSNLAEGSGRKSGKELANFLNIALGSLIELETQIEIAIMLGYITDDNKQVSIDDSLRRVKQLLLGLIRSLKNED